MFAHGEKHPAYTQNNTEYLYDRGGLNRFLFCVILGVYIVHKRQQGQSIIWKVEVGRKSGQLRSRTWASGSWNATVIVPDQSSGPFSLTVNSLITYPQYTIDISASTVGSAGMASHGQNAVHWTSKGTGRAGLTACR